MLKAIVLFRHSDFCLCSPKNIQMELCIPKKCAPPKKKRGPKNLHQKFARSDSSEICSNHVSCFHVSPSRTASARCRRRCQNTFSEEHGKSMKSMLQNTCIYSNFTFIEHALESNRLEVGCSHTLLTHL